MNSTSEKNRPGQVLTELILKELRQYLLSYRFLMGFLLSLVLVTSAAFFLSSLHKEEMKRYSEHQIESDRFLDKYAHLNRLSAVSWPETPPSPMVLVEGISERSNMETLVVNPFAELFPPMDLNLVVAFILSLFAIVLGFDAVNGEKESGTLKLMLSNAVRRPVVLLAKWIAALIVLALSIVVALAAGCLVVQTLSGADWGRSEWLSFLLIGAASIVYCGAFYTFSLLMSCAFQRSSVSVLTSLFGWILVVLIIPNMSPYLAAQLVRVPSRAALERDLQFIQSEERDQIVEKAFQQINAKYWKPLQFGVLSREEIKRRVAEDPAYRKLYNEHSREIEKALTDINQKQREKANRRSEAFDSLARRQFELSRNLSLISPFSAFVYTTTEASLTGLDMRKDFEKQVDTYSGILNNWGRRRYEAEKSKNPSFSWNDFLDVSGRPRFQYQEPTFGQRLGLVLPYGGILIFWNLVLLGACFGSFQRFDVR